MKRIALVLWIVSLAANLAAAGLVHRKGGLPWLARQFKKVTGGGATKGVRVDMFTRLPDARGDIYMVGDSITEMCEWAELTGNPHVRNRGISGETTQHILSRLDEITVGKPAKVFLMVGVNDLQRGSSVEDTLACCRQIVEQIVTQCPDTDIVIQSVLPINEYLYRQYIVPSFPGIHIPETAEVQAINDGLRTMVGEPISYVDLWPAMVMDGQLKAEYTFDGLHVNGAGYMTWAREIADLIQPQPK